MKGALIMAVIRRKIRRNNSKVDWENDTKEQPYLMPGSSEYEEYQNDLHMHDPFRPDDEWHNELEEKNEEQFVPKSEPKEAPSERVNRWKFIRQQSKASQFDDVKNAATIAAEETESKKDDKRVAHMKKKDLEEIVFDDGVDDEEYVSKTIRKYID